MYYTPQRDFHNRFIILLLLITFRFISSVKILATCHFLYSILKFKY